MPSTWLQFGLTILAGSIPFPGRKDGSLAFADIPQSSAMALNKFKPGREQWRRILSVQQGLPLSITLTWIDRPGHGLQQNLDLLVIAPGGHRLFGNPGMKRPSFSKGDRTNNVEWVRIENPEEGDYVVHVLAYNTPYEDQSFSIVATGKLALPDFH